MMLRFFFAEWFKMIQDVCLKRVDTFSKHQSSVSRPNHCFLLLTLLAVLQNLLQFLLLPQPLDVMPKRIKQGKCETEKSQTAASIFLYFPWHTAIQLADNSICLLHHTTLLSRLQRCAGRQGLKPGRNPKKEKIRAFWSFTSFTWRTLN